MLLTSTGLLIEHDIAAAAAAQTVGGGLVGVMALLGAYVGVLPVVLGLLFLPVLRRAGGQVVQVLLGVTVGLLLVPPGAGGSLLLLSTVDRLIGGRAGTDGRRLALMIAIGIGLHNLGEGCPSDRPTRWASWPWAPAWCWGSRCTTPPRGWPSSPR